MDNLQYDEALAANDPSLWEQVYLYYVTEGRVSVDEWVLDWFKHRIKLPEDKEFSLFKNRDLINTNLVGVKIRLSLSFQGKERFAKLEVYYNNSFQPDYECTHLPDAANARFESVGNPYIDGPNYRWWEEYLAFKLISEILFEQGGLDAIIEGIYRHR